jgi:hypothetical protein
MLKCTTLKLAFFLTLTEAKKANLAIDNISAEEVKEIVQGLYKIEPAFITRMKQVLVP